MHRIPNTLAEVQQDGHDIIAVCRNKDCRHARYVDLDRMLKRIGGRTPLLPQPDQDHYSDRMRCPVCKGRGMFVWFQPTIKKLKAQPHPNYIIVDRGSAYPYGEFNIIGTADNLMVARAGYSAAAMFFSDHEITLQQGTYVLMDSRRDGLPKPLTLQNFVEIRKMEQELNSGSMAKPKPEQVEEATRRSKAS